MDSPHVRNTFPSEGRSREEERENAVNVMLQDMQRSLPIPMEPMTLSAVRDYMVTTLTTLEQHRHFDTLVMRNSYMEMLIRDGTTRLINLNTRAQTLHTALMERASADGAVLREYNFSPESFQRILRQLAALETRLLVCDTEYMTLRILNDSLQRESEQNRSVLQRRAAEREQAWEMLQEREEELKRTKHILERVEAERDRSRRTVDYVVPQLHNLESRLQESERIYKGSNRSVKLLTNTLSQQGHAAAARAVPAPAGVETTSTGTNTEPRTGLQQDLEPRQDKRVRSGSRFADLLARLAVKDSEMGGSTAEEKAPVEGGDAPVRKPVTPKRIIPCVPLLPPTPIMTPIMRARSVKKQGEGAARSLPR